MAGPQGRLALLISLICALVFCVLGKRATGTIDDGETDSKPGYGIAFLPAKNGHWNDGTACTVSSPFCLAAETSRAFGQTWTSTALFGTSVTRSVVIDFFGDGISVFFTLVDTGPQNVSTLCNFVLDDRPAEQYRHTPEQGEQVAFTYQAKVFSPTGLEHGAHRLVISVPSSAQDGNYLNFDYAEYSYDDELAPPTGTAALAPNPTVTTTIYVNASETSNAQNSPSSSTKLPNEGVFKAAIIGGSVSGAVVVIVIVLFLLYRARRKRNGEDRLTFGVPSTYAGSTRKLSLPFWPHKPAYDDQASNLQNLTALPQKRRSGSSYSNSPYQEKYDADSLTSPATTAGQIQGQDVVVNSHDRASILSPTKALMESFYPGHSRRDSATTGKLSRLEDSLSPTSTFPRQLSRFSDLRGRGRDGDTIPGTISSSNHVLPMQTPPSGRLPMQNPPGSAAARHHNYI